MTAYWTRCALGTTAGLSAAAWLAILVAAAAAQDAPATKRSGEQSPFEDAKGEDAKGEDAKVEVAKVDGEPILAGEVQRELAEALRGRDVQPAALASLQAEALRQVINRRLVVNYLARSRQGASEQDVDQAIRRIQRRLQQQERSFQDYLGRSGMTEGQLRRWLAWQLGWQRYLDRYLTDENLQNFFERHRADFDGRQVRVAHILWKVQAPHDRAALDAALAGAEKVRREITAGKTTFAAAAGVHSDAPTANQGGDLGFISRHDPMPEPISRAAFGLEQDQISGPVVTPFGVHLLQCREIKPGRQTWEDAREPLRQAVTRYLFQWVADRQRGQSQIEFSGAFPYLKPGTNELIDPKQDE